MTQKQQVKQYFEDNQNKAMHFKTIANELNILVPNMRRILGQGTLKGEFIRVSKGVYKLNKDVEISINLATKLFKKGVNSLNEEESKTLYNLLTNNKIYTNIYK